MELQALPLRPVRAADPVPLTLAPAGRLGGFLCRRPLHDLGVISYGVYLWHLPLLLAVQRWLGYGTFEGHFWIC